MNLIIYLIAEAVVGYLASRIVRTNSQQGLLAVYKAIRRR